MDKMFTTKIAVNILELLASRANMYLNKGQPVTAAIFAQAWANLEMQELGSYLDSWIYQENQSFYYWGQILLNKQQKI